MDTINNNMNFSKRNYLYDVILEEFFINLSLLRIYGRTLMDSNPIYALKASLLSFININGFSVFTLVFPFFMFWD